MRKTFFLLLLLASNFLNAQQKPDPVNEQWTFFPYAVGERTDKKLQVLIIGTHLLRFKTLTNGSNVPVELSLDFGKMIDEIQKNERYHPNDYDNIGFSATEIEDLNGNYLKWHGDVIRNNDLSSTDNTLSAMEKIRTKLIDSYRAKGYKVYQVDYKMDLEHAYGYYDISVPTYKPMQFERLAPLSPLYVRVYQRGEIKDLLSRITKNMGSSGGGGLVIESTNDKKKDNNSGTSSGGSGGGSHKMTDEEIRIDISYRKTLAETAAVEGDRLYQMGTMFYPAALEKYKQAQAQYYSSDVQRRIDEISGWMVLGQSINKLAEGVDNMAANVDPDKKTRWVYWGPVYGGLGGNYDKISNGANHQPMEGLIAVTGHRLCFSFETRIGYFKSPVYEYIVTVNANNPETPYKVQTENSAIGLGISGGLNIPLKSLVLYGMIGVDMKLFNTSYKIMPSQFSFTEEVSAADFPSFDTRLSFGASYRIPKSKIGFKVEYVMHDIKGEEDGATAIKYSANPSGHYYLNRTTDEKYKFSNYSVGINFAL
jgi:hypothetical protein